MKNIYVPIQQSYISSYFSKEGCPCNLSYALVLADCGSGGLCPRTSVVQRDLIPGAKWELLPAQCLRFPGWCWTFWAPLKSPTT